jgi:hypothetical protein
MTLEDIMLSGKNQSQKNRCCVIPGSGNLHVVLKAEKFIETEEW